MTKLFKHHDFLLYYFPSPNDAKFGTHVQTEVVIEKEQVKANLLKVFKTPPKLDVILAWQSFITSKFPDIDWFANVKVAMKALDTEDQPKVGRPKEFTISLKGEVRHD